MYLISFYYLKKIWYSNLGTKINFKILYQKNIGFVILKFLISQEKPFAF